MCTGKFQRCYPAAYFHVNEIPSLAAGIIENPVLQPVAVAALSV
jgi:hypothetical protein